MALPNWMPQYFSQDFETPQMFDLPYLMHATDRSYDVPVGNNKGSWADPEGSVTTQTYTERTDLTDTQGNLEVYVLEIDQKDAFNITLDDLERTQQAPGIMADYTVQGVREMMWEINKNNREVFETGARLKASGLTEPIRGNPNGLTGNVHNVALGTSGGSGTTIDSKDGRAAIVRAMDKQARAFALRQAWVAPKASTNGVCIVPIEVAAELREYLWHDAPNLGAGSTVESAFGYGEILRVQGWEIVEDTTLPEIDLTQAGTIKLNFLHPQGKSLYYGRQLSRLRSEMVQKQFTNRLMGLYLHGATQGAARNIQQITLTLS